MKVAVVRVNKTEKDKFAAFIDEVNECLTRRQSLKRAIMRTP